MDRGRGGEPGRGEGLRLYEALFAGIGHSPVEVAKFSGDKITEFFTGKK